jgi:hypothetical protein
LPETISLELEGEKSGPFVVLSPGQRFAEGYTGKFIPQGGSTRAVLGIYVEGSKPLLPSTRYTVKVKARSKRGAMLPAKEGAWQFKTEQAAARHVVHLKLAADAPTARWQGGFFTGFCGVTFCNGRQNRIPTFELMKQTRKWAPRAWSLQRDFWLTGMEYQPGFLSGSLPNIVRERETRRIVAIDADRRGSVLHTEDFYGHEQYGIPTGRPVSADYHPGDEVLIADGVHDARAKVIAVDDAPHAIVVTRFAAPPDGWKLAYTGPLPQKENPDQPGLFPPGGCYVRKFRPSGTPAYYWGRLNAEWDLAVQRYHRRVVPNFADAPGDLAMDGRSWATAKDYVELHEVTRAITGHIIERYGDVVLAFPWSIFNEPDLGALFWRADWNELQKFYDYSVDGILRAFEDHGYDSKRVIVGGLELGGIFGTNLRLKEFLVHCSPRAAPADGALIQNSAFADPRLRDRRSRRVEDLCRANGGRGSPCDFISIHSYDLSKLMADKLAKAKETALAIDGEYYAGLRINSHESCPGWDLPPDPAYGDSYLGNGYFPTWCADVARRQLARAAADPRYAYGESILTFWPWPNANFGGGNDCVRALSVDDDGDGVTDRTVTVPMPILHFLGLLAAMGPEFYVLPEQTVGGHVVSGLASMTDGTLRILLYSHHMLDTESRSESEFEVRLDLAAFQQGPVLVRQYRFDKDHNSYFHLGRRLREQPDPKAPPETARRLQAALHGLDSQDRARRLLALENLAALGHLAAPALAAVFQLHEKTDDPQLRELASATLKRIMTPRAYPAAVVHEVEKLSALRPTALEWRKAEGQDFVSLIIRVAGNGANHIIIERPARALPALLLPR